MVNAAKGTAHLIKSRQPSDFLVVSADITPLANRLTAPGGVPKISHEFIVSVYV